MIYGITAATGRFGQEAYRELSKIVNKDDIVILARDLDRAAEIFPDAKSIKKADYNDLQTLQSSFSGIDRLLFISSIPGGAVARIDQHKNVISAARAAGVSYIAYTSFPNAQKSSAFLAQDHIKTENLIEEAGLGYSFLRNNWYLENEAAAIKASAKGADFIYSAADGQVGWALEKYYAQAAARVLSFLDPQKIYEFAGPLTTYRELAQTVKNISGQNFAIKEVDDQDYRKQLSSQGIGEKQIDGIIAISDIIRNRQLAVASNDLEKVLGGQLPSLAESVKELLK